MLKRVLYSLQWICCLIIVLGPAGTALAQDISPAHEQEFMDAKTAVEAAQKANAAKYEPDKLKEAADYLSKAGQARTAKDDLQFSRSSRLARAFAESARAWTELKIEQGKLSATQTDLQKIKTDIKRLDHTK